MESARVMATMLLIVQLLVQAPQINCDSANDVTQPDAEYIGKYLPQMWTALKQTNAKDVHLLKMKRLEVPALRLYKTMKLCIIKYLQAIKPVAHVKLNDTDNCAMRVVRIHADVLRIASTKGFRCLNVYKIGLSNVYVDAPQLAADEQMTLDKTYDDCLLTLEAKAIGDFQFLNGTISKCLDEIAGVATATSESSMEFETSTIESNNNGNDSNIHSTENLSVASSP